MNDQSTQQTAAQSPVTPSNSGGQGMVSLEQVAKLVSDTVSQALEGYNRSQQSQRDKMEARINERIKSYSEVVKQTSGADITPEQEQVLARRARREVEAEEKSNSQNQVSQTAAQPEQVSDADRETIRAIEEIFSEAGIIVEENDPEYADIAAATTPLKLIRATEKAVKDKSARLKASGGVSDNAAGRMPVASSTSSPSNLEAEYKEKAKKLQGNVNAIFQLTQEYRKLGLKI